jgi:1-acylglycerone phosphate reductase
MLSQAYSCNEFAKRGCKVYATARNVQKMQGLGNGIEKLPLDVNNEESIQTTVKHIMEKEGKIDILVNNAGFGDSGI